MKIQEKTSNICKEVLTVLSMCEEELIEKIPVEIFEKLKDSAADSNIEVFINADKELLDQNISQESKDLIALIYIQYVANEKEKVELQKILNENEKQYKENLKQSEIANVLFNEKREESLTADETKEKSNNMIEEYRESFWSKIKLFISKIFKR